MQPFQVLGDCHFCLVEGAVVELYDPSVPACHLGVPAETRCRMCRRRTVGIVSGPSGVPTSTSLDLLDEICPSCGDDLPSEARESSRCPWCGLGASSEERAAPIELIQREQVSRALDRWATEEGYPNAAEMLVASFELTSVDEVHASLVANKPVGTSFDVLGFLFAHIGAGAGAGGGGAPVMASDGESRPNWVEERTELVLSGPTGRIKLPSARPPHRRNRALPLIAVMAVDGKIREAERRFVAAMLSSEGLAPLDDGEIRVLRPHEVGPVGSLKDRENLVELMVQLAHIDGEKDESEMRLIREYARHWGVDPSRVAAWEKRHEAEQGSRLRRFARRFRSLLTA